MGLKFYKMSGLGNDFVFIDNFDDWLTDSPADLARRLCPRAVSVGADGLVVLEPDPDPEVDFRWRFHNADGSEAEMCGNAARCAARLAHDLGRVGPKLSFRTVAGVLRAEVKGTEVKVEMTRPHGATAKIDLAVDGQALDAGFVDTGVPHCVIFGDDPRQIDIDDLIALGRKVRHHQRFGAAGTNVMFVSQAGPNRFRQRSYERGVENETLACGTGTVATALIAHLRGLAQSPTEVIVSTGEVITVHYAPNPDRASDWPGPVFMEGATKLVYTAELSGEVA